MNGKEAPFLVALMAHDVTGGWPGHLSVNVGPDHANTALHRAVHLSTVRCVQSPEVQKANVQAKRPLSIHDVDNGKLLGFGADLAEDHPVRPHLSYCQSFCQCT